jgi:hypothetical protein
MLRLLSSLLAAAPVTFALLQAVRTGDLRYTWIAVSSYFATLAVMRVGRARDRSIAGILLLSTVSFVVATGLALVTARQLGATSLDAGAAAVCGAFAICWTSAYALSALSRPAALIDEHNAHG